jgi:hypothetical protein
MEGVYARIRDDLRALREARQPPDVFGSQMHGFRTHPPLSDDDVREFEQAHRITLPAEYRGFLIHVGNGGAGPAYGLFKLGEMDDNRGHAPWREGGGFVGVLSRPFPHTGPWNDLSGRPAQDDEREMAEDPEYEAEWEQWEEEYFSPAQVCGAIPICHLGCALRLWLVVTGPEAGHVWCDDRADHGGLYPLEQGGSPRLTFLRWYRSWLDEAMRKLHEAGPA